MIERRARVLRVNVEQDQLVVPLWLPPHYPELGISSALPLQWRQSLGNAAFDSREFSHAIVAPATLRA